MITRRAGRLLHKESVPLSRKLATNSLAVCRGMAVLLAVRTIALAHPGMILIREVADAPVIMGISKPAGLKSQHKGGENREPIIRWH